MGSLSLGVSWVVQDLFVFVAALIAIFFIIRREEHPESVLMEMLCFVALYAAVYENFATLMGYYAYGKSLIMIGNVPLSVPLVEYLVVYSVLRLVKHMKVPVWSGPVIVGFAAMLFDFALDPLAIKLFETRLSTTVARWTWFMGPADAAIYGEPVFNFTGWVLICGYAAALLLLGRFWHKRSGYNRALGFIYPAAAMVVSLGLVVSPLSNFLLWAQPFFQRGSVVEWIMLGFWIVVPVALLAGLWRGRLREPFHVKDNIPVLVTLVALPLVSVISAILYGQFEVLWLMVSAAVVLWLFVLGVAWPRRIRVHT